MVFSSTSKFQSITAEIVCTPNALLSVFKLTFSRFSFEDEPLAKRISKFQLRCFKDNDKLMESFLIQLTFPVQKTHRCKTMTEAIKSEFIILIEDSDEYRQISTIYFC